jgi:uncharacterized protein YhbP (UPF0306 family)
MSKELAERVVSFLDAHHVMSLATLGEDGPHATSVFYVRDGFALIWISDPDSKHSVHIEALSKTAATIAPDYADFPEIQGLQISGHAERITGELERVGAQRLLQSRYLFLQRLAEAPKELLDAYKRAQFYRLNPDRIVLIDNRRGFGSKETLCFGQDKLDGVNACHSQT